MPTTEYLGWTKPTVDGSDSTWGQTVNDRIDDIDSLAGGVTVDATVTGAHDVDLAVGTGVFQYTVTGDVTFSFINPNASPSLSSFRLYITMSGTRTITWPSSVKWAGGIEPSVPGNGQTDSFTFESLDGGTTWYGYHTGDNFAIVPEPG